MKRSVYFPIYLVVILAIFSCDEKPQTFDQGPRTIVEFPDTVKQKLIAQDSLMNELVSIIDTLTLELNSSKKDIAELRQTVDRIESPKSTLGYMSLAAIILAIIAIVLIVLKAKSNKEERVKEIVDQMLDESSRITGLKTTINTLSKSQQFDSKTLRDIEYRMKKIETQIPQLLKVRTEEKESKTVQPLPPSTPLVSTQGQIEQEYHKVGYAKVGTDTYFTTIYESNQEGCVFKITFTSPTEGRFNIISLDKIQSRNDWQQKVECSGVSIKDASDFRVEENGLCEKIDENTWKVTKPLKIKLMN